MRQLTVENWQELDLPLSASSWSEQDLKDPDKFYEMTVLLNAQREISDKILDAQWETKWRQEKVIFIFPSPVYFVHGERINISELILS